jgi:hypothetical protein
VTDQSGSGPARAGRYADAAWRKATASQANDGCVEAAYLPDGGVGVRDSKAPHQEPLVLTRRQWRFFLAAAKAGEFDLPA